jgi:serine/threonine protein kinase
MSVSNIKNIGRYIVADFICRSSEAWIFSGHWENQIKGGLWGGIPPIETIYRQNEIFKHIAYTSDYVPKYYGFETFTYNGQTYYATIMEKLTGQTLMIFLESIQQNKTQYSIKMAHHLIIDLLSAILSIHKHRGNPFKPLIYV